MRSHVRLPAAAVAVLALVGGGAIWFAGSAASPPPPISNASPVPSLVPSPLSSPAATRSAAPSPTADTVLGWPGNRGGTAPGLYSWDEVKCEPTDCIMGVLHRHDVAPDTDLRIQIKQISEPSVGADATPITVAGHEGLYERTDPDLEVWNVAFDGTLVSISLSLKGDVSKELVDEAHSIIESLAYERRDTTLGFRLVFRLPSSSWDSPF